MADEFVTASRHRRNWKLGARGAAAVFVGVLAVYTAKNWYDTNSRVLSRTFDLQRVELIANSKTAEQLIGIGDELISELSCAGVNDEVESQSSRNYRDFAASIPTEQQRDLLEASWDPTSVREMLGHQCSANLAIMVKNQPDLLEIFVTDRYGLNVCMSQETSDYVQSDEDWWLDVFRADALNVKNGIVGIVEYDDSAGAWAVPISLPISNSNEELIGIAKAVFDVRNLALDAERTVFCQRPALSN